MIGILLKLSKFVRSAYAALEQTLSKYASTWQLRILFAILRAIKWLNRFLLPTLHVKLQCRHFILQCLLVSAKQQWKQFFSDQADQALDKWNAWFIYSKEESELRVQLLKDIENASSYEEWKSASDQLDVLEGRMVWRETESPEQYDGNRVKSQTALLKDLLAKEDQYGIMWFLRSSLHRNSFGINNPLQYTHLRSETKKDIELYISTILESLQFISKENQAPGPVSTQTSKFFTIPRSVRSFKSLLVDEDDPENIANCNGARLNSSTHCTMKNLLPALGHAQGKITLNKLPSELFLHRAPSALMNSPTKEDNSQRRRQLQARLRFFYEQRHAYGRTAQLQSGGSTMGVYHLGVVKEMVQLGILPRIISGSSVGAIVAAVVGTRTDDEQTKLFQEQDQGSLDLCFFQTTTLCTSIARAVNGLSLLEGDRLKSGVQSNVGHCTFQEAYERTGKVLNITVSPAFGGAREECRLLNYLTAPTVLIWSAAMASCALPGVFPSVEQVAKDRQGNEVPFLSEEVRWEDGSVAADLPAQRLGEMLSVTHCVVSQVNPHVVPFLNIGKQRGHRNESRILSWLRQPLSSVIEYLSLEMEALLHRLANSSPVSLPAYLSLLIHQTYQGHITIYPPYNLRDQAELITNPSPHKIRRGVIGGQRQLWEKTLEITVAYSIERVIVQCIEALKQQINQDSN